MPKIYNAQYFLTVILWLNTYAEHRPLWYYNIYSSGFCVKGILKYFCLLHFIVELLQIAFRCIRFYKHVGTLCG